MLIRSCQRQDSSPPTPCTLDVLATTTTLQLVLRWLPTLLPLLLEMVYGILVDAELAYVQPGRICRLPSKIRASGWSWS